MNDIMKARLTRLINAWDAAEQRKNYGPPASDGRYPEAYGWLSSAVKTFVEECRADVSP